MFFAIYATTYRWSKPLKMMSAAAKSMAKGDFSRRIPIMSDDEIGELSASFNQMTNSLVQLESMRRSFIANVSHELKTPMTTISGFIDGILDGTIDSDKESYYLNIVSKEVKRLSRLVESMLSLSKLESGENKINPVSFDLCETICNVVISQEQRINEKSINIIGLDGLVSTNICADRDLIYQVIYNLTDNAIKFTNENGNISFSLSQTNDKIVFTINNTGDIIPKNDLPHIFERFYKSDKSRSDKKNSTGLGLYIVKTIIKLHKGTVYVQSNEEIGTTFTVNLPINYK
jgi:signal transduction histidine kinase